MAPNEAVPRERAAGMTGGGTATDQEGVTRGAGAVGSVRGVAVVEDALDEERLLAASNTKNEVETGGTGSDHSSSPSLPVPGAAAPALAVVAVSDAGAATPIAGAAQAVCAV